MSKQRSDGVDRISDLPEELIIHILSLLPTTEDRITTEVLSRRWKGLWTCVPKLDFEFNYGFTAYPDEDYVKAFYREVDDFVNHVNKTLNRILSSSGGTKVNNFRLRLPFFYNNFSFDVDDIVMFAEKNETELFELDFHPFDGAGFSCDLPSNIYKNPYFRELRFNNCGFDIPDTVSWDSLKKLTIRLESPLSHVRLEKMLVGAPALEFLELHLSKAIPKLHIGNSVLKKFVLHIQHGWDSRHEKEGAFEITAPSVESLQVSGRFRTCKLVGMASLVEATLFGMSEETDSGYPTLTEEVVSSLLNVKTLTVDTWVMQGIGTLANDACLLFPECKSLTVNTHLWKEDPSAIARLLKNTPQVETLNVTMSDSDSKHKFRKDNPSGHGNSIIDQYWTSQEMGANYLMSLRTVKFIDFWAYRAVAFPFLQFLLKNARGLQKVIIDFGTEDSMYGVPATEVFETSYFKPSTILS